MDDNPEYARRESQWDEQWPSTEATTSEHASRELDNLDEVAPFPKVTGTSDVIESVRDGEPYMPPTDPPVLPGGPEGIHTATGFGVSPHEENYEERLPTGDEDIRDEAILTLGQDSLTSHYVLDVDVQDGVVYLRGNVQSIEDADHAATLLGNIAGVHEVVDNTTLEATAGQ